MEDGEEGHEEGVDDNFASRCISIMVVWGGLMERDSVPVGWAGAHPDESLLIHGSLDRCTGVRDCSAKSSGGEDEDEDVDERSVAQPTSPLDGGDSHG